jgi:hypothetical protein
MLRSTIYRYPCVIHKSIHFVNTKTNYPDGSFHYSLLMAKVEAVHYIFYRVTNP